MGFCLMAIAEEDQGVLRQAKDPRLGEDKEGIDRAIFVLQLHTILVQMPTKPPTRV